MNYKKTTAAILTGTSMLVGGAVVDARVDPYTDVGTQKEIRAESVIPEAKTNRILADMTKPKVTMEKFGGEVALGINYNKIKGKGNRPLFSKNIEWKQGNETMEMVPIEATTTMEDGGMEINIILAKKPDTNVFDFQLDNWENLDFFYQPDLTPEEIAEGASRPENVIGSYAVYYKDHANHIEGQTNYATGKAYHIFRPLVTDADGATVWADMSYANGILTVTVPQSFLDGAAYPVKVDPTFGYTTVGGTAVAFISTNRNIVSGVSTHLVASGDVVTATNVYAQCTVSGSGTVGTAIFATTSSSTAMAASTRITEILTHTINSTTAKWYQATPTPRLLPVATTTTIGVGAFNAGTCAVLNLFRDVTSGAKNVQDNGSLSNDFFSADYFHNVISTASQYSLYADYTTGNTNSSGNIAGVTDTYGIRVPSQVLGFYAAGGYWQFWSNGFNEVYATSTDGVNWSASTTLVTGIIKGAAFSLYYDGSKVSYVRTNTDTPAATADKFTGLFYRRGTPNADGTITWDAAEQTIKTTATFVGGDPHIIVDSNGYPWVGVMNYATATPAFDKSLVFKSSTNNGTWTTDSGFPYTLKTRDHDDAMLIPLSTGQVYAISYINNSGVGTPVPIVGRLWNGSAWGSEEAVTTSNVSNSYFQKVSITNINDDVYVAFQKDSTFDMITVKRPSATGVWSSETTVQSGTNATSSPLLANDGTNIYMIWPDSPSSNIIYAKALNIACNTWDASPTVVSNETTESLTYNASGMAKGWGGAWDVARNGKIGVYYQTTNAAHHHIRLTLWTPTSDGCPSTGATIYGATLRGATIY